MEEKDKKKKTIISMVLGIAVLSILVLGATYAYFTVGTSNNFGSKTISATTPEIGSVALTSGESLSLNMTSELMMEENVGTYYATTTGVPSSTLVETDIAVAEVIGAGTFDCTYDLTITPSATNSLYTAFIGMTGHDSNQIVLKVGNNNYDFNVEDFSSPITVHEKLSGLRENRSKSLKASLMFNNTNFDQNALQGKDITFTFTASNFSCKAVDYTTATFDTGQNVESRMFNLAMGPSNITKFERSSTLPSEYESSEYEIQSNDSGEKIYMWYNNGTIKYYTEAEKIYLNENSSNMFAGGSSFVSIDLHDVDTSRVTNMSNMFVANSSLTSLNLSNFDTSNVTNMQSMFNGCSSLTSLNLSGLNMSNASSDAMFSGIGNSATSLSINLSNSKLPPNSVGLFKNLSKLSSINFTNTDTSNVINMKSMFYGCSNLTSLDLSSFDTSSVIDMSEMFLNNSKLSYLDVSSFNTSSVTNMSTMFLGTDKLNVLDLSSFDTTLLSNTSGMFSNAGATIGYAKTQADADVFNASAGKSDALVFNLKQPIDPLVGKFVTLDNVQGIYYRVLWNETGNTYMVMRMNNDLEEIAFNSSTDSNVYEGSTLDTYMNETFYNSNNLTNNIRSAIVANTITQKKYEPKYDTAGTTKGDTTYTYQYEKDNLDQYEALNFISESSPLNRKIYALDIEDVYRYMSAKKGTTERIVTMAELNDLFFNLPEGKRTYEKLGLRSSGSGNYRIWTIYDNYGYFYYYYGPDITCNVRPAFLIDLSKVNYNVVDPSTITSQQLGNNVIS